MKIDKKLNLVVPIERDDSTLIYIHSTPIAREVFERYFLTISQVLSAIHNEGLGEVSGPRVASLLLRRAAERSGSWDGTEGVKHGLVDEIYRLSNVLCPTPKGWDMIPLQDAISQDFIDAEDASVAENILVFFTVVSSMYPRRDRKKGMDWVCRLWNVQTELLTCTEFAASLPISKETVNTGAKVKPSSIPS